MNTGNFFSWVCAVVCTMTFAAVSVSTGHAANSEAQNSTASVQAKNVVTPQPLLLGRGVNAMGYDPIWNQFEKRRFQEDYFQKIKAAGFDHIRLNLHPFGHMTESEEGIKFKEGWESTLDWLSQSLRSGLKISLIYMNSRH